MSDKDLDIQLEQWLQEILEEPTKEVVLDKCTCGAERTYGRITGHSEWCDRIKFLNRRWVDGKWV